MSIIAQKTELNFEPKMLSALDATGKTETPEALRPTLGPVSNLMYKPARFQYLVRLSETTTGTVRVLLFAGEVEKKRITVNLSELESGGDLPLDLDGVGGAVPWSVAIDVVSEGGAGVTATLDAKMVVDTPATVV